MSNALREVLLERADRTDPAVLGDPRAVLAAVRERAEQRRRTRRNAAAAGGGALLIAALVVGAVVLPSSGQHSGGAPVGGPGSHTAPTPGRSAPAGPGSPAGRSVTAAERSAADAARSAAESRASSAASRAASRAATVRTLVSVSTPKAAAVAVGLVPKGWHYVGRLGPLTYYGPDAMAPTNGPDVQAVIVLDVHERLSSDSSGYTLTVDGRPAQYGVDSGVTVVTVVVDATTDVNMQLPVTAPVTRTQALQIAATLDVRSTADKTKG